MTGIALTIRSAQAFDLEAMTAIAQLCFGSGAWRRHQFELDAADTAQRWSCIAVDDTTSACIGYLVMALVLDEAELQALAVTPSSQNHGVGTALLTTGLATATQRGAQRVFLEVRASNLAAQRFYRRFQFLEFARRPHYYHEPDETAVLMRRQWPGTSASGF